MSRRIGAYVMALTLWATPAAAGFVTGAGEWACDSTRGVARGGTLVECLANLLVAQLGNTVDHERWADPSELFEAGPGEPLRTVHPAKHAHARAFADAVRDGREMLRLRTVLSAIQRTPAGLTADPQTQERLQHLRAAWLRGQPAPTLRGAGGTLVLCGLRGADGPLRGWGPSPVECLADLLLLACPAGQLDAQRCAAETPLRDMTLDAAGSATFVEQLTAWAGADIADGIEPAPIARPDIWLMPEPEQVRDRAHRRVRALRDAFRTPD